MTPKPRPTRRRRADLLVHGGGERVDLGRLRSLQDWYVGPQLASVAGVAEVASVGGFPVEYQVSIVPYRLRREG